MFFLCVCCTVVIKCIFSQSGFVVMTKNKKQMAKTAKGPSPLRANRLIETQKAMESASGMNALDIAIAHSLHEPANDAINRAAGEGDEFEPSTSESLATSRIVTGVRAMSVQDDEMNASDEDMPYLENEEEDVPPAVNMADKLRSKWSGTVVNSKLI